MGPPPVGPRRPARSRRAPTRASASTIWDCTGGANQSWTVEQDGTLQVYGKCMDITGANYNNGTNIELWQCNGGANQQWHLP